MARISGVNIPLNKRDFIIRRAHECIAERGKIPNLLLTDYYNRGDLVRTVAELNGVTSVKPASTTPVDFG